MIPPIFHDKLPLNESDTSCYDQKQMKKIFGSLWCMCWFRLAALAVTLRAIDVVFMFCMVPSVVHLDQNIVIACRCAKWRLNKFEMERSFAVCETKQLLISIFFRLPFTTTFIK